MLLKNKKVIVTGGLRGLGKAMVSALLHEGAQVGIFDIDTAGFADVQKSNISVFCLECDVTNPDQVKRAVDRFYGEFGQIDGLINNAGVIYSEPLVRFSPQGVERHDTTTWDRLIVTNLSSVFYMTAHVVEKMVLKRTKGVIINIGSICAAGNAGQSVYSAAKAGVNALTATWARELGILGIRVVGIAPGFFDTESTHQALSKDTLRHIVKNVPLRRLGRVEEVADGIVSILQNDFINGTTIAIDGGLTL